MKRKRELCTYQDLSQRFLYTKKRNFNLQYSQLYAVRLMKMKDMIKKAARLKWPHQNADAQLADIEENKTCVVIGTLFRKMELQPSILKEISQEEGVLPIPPSEKYISDTDVLILEQQQQRIILEGNISLSEVITGMVVAVKGYTTEGGKFHVEEHCFCEVPQRSSVQLDQCLLDGDDRYIAFVSGLGIGGDQEKSFELQMMVDLLTGALASQEDQLKFSKVCRVIIAGNSLSCDTQDKDSEKVAKYLSRNTQAKSVDAIKRLDEYLVQLSSSVPVDIMPGQFDPANQFLPQQPLHKCMFPQASSYKSLQSVTNPYEAEIGGVRIMGTSGQNVTNIFQFSGFEDRCSILETTLRCSHISPTSPDTLSCYPYHNDDPFVLETCPHVYFAGNQPKFEVKHLKGEQDKLTLMLCVPSFKESGILVLMNLRDLSCIPVVLDTKLI